MPYLGKEHSCLLKKQLTSVAGTQWQEELSSTLAFLAHKAFSLNQVGDTSEQRSHK